MTPEERAETQDYLNKIRDTVDGYRAAIEELEDIDRALIYELADLEVGNVVMYRGAQHLLVGADVRPGRYGGISWYGVPRKKDGTWSRTQSSIAFFSDERPEIVDVPDGGMDAIPRGLLMVNFKPLGQDHGVCST